jgi:3-dehydroquinate dehydratase/shikimate dehydrogenase
MIPIVTERLILRPWRKEDKPAFAEINADPEVMRFFPSTLTRSQSDSLADRLAAAETEEGMTFFATEEQATGRFIGIIGLKAVAEELPIAPAVEIGWRLARDVWGRGLAPEGARAVLRAGFEEAGLDRIVSYTSVANTPSRRVMEKIGLIRQPDGDFDHPFIAAGHPLQRQVLYAVDREAWLRTPAAVVGT